MSAVSTLISWNRPSTGWSGGGASRRPCGPAAQLLVRPSLAVLSNECGQESRMLDAGIQRGDILESLAARTHERVAILDINLLERLETIDGKSGTDHGDILHPAAGHLAEHAHGVGLEPLRRSEARLE